MTFCNQKGFTLVELAIVMVVIGLLIGGILKGAEMIHTSKINRSVSDLQAIHGAYVGFLEKYGGKVPGDMLNPQNFIPDCNATSGCLGGDGNKFVGTWTSHDNWYQDQLGTNVPERETTQFWKHLALAGFITGINPYAAADATPEFGVTHPRIALGGGLTAIHLVPNTTSTGPNVNTNFRGNAVRMQYTLGAGNVTTEGKLSEHDAYLIDLKLDDSLSQSGRVQAEGDCDGGDYYTGGNSMNCVLFYIMN